MLKLATLVDNPGEPVSESRYRDPAELAALGYNALVIYETTGLSGIGHPDALAPGEIRRWVEHQFEQVHQRIERAVAARLDVYIFYDVLSLPRELVAREVASLTCKNRPTVLCPASEPAVDFSVRALESLLVRWPEVRGVVLRLGDNDAARLPYLLGNEIYTPHCARCSQFGRVDRIASLLDKFHRLVVERFDKRLIARAWNVRPKGMHDSVEVCQRLRDRLPGSPADDRLVLSFKFTETDFWRYQRWNPASLVFGDRPILYEFECQREFEGKGGIPNWQVPLWRDGCPETRDTSEVHGLAEAASRVNLAGVWAWVRGGGWGGPFVKKETWIDANVVAVPTLADNPRADPGTLAQSWIESRLGLVDPAEAAVIRAVLEHSPEVALKGFYIGPFARAKADPWHPNGDFIQDDLIDVQAAWRMIQRIPEPQLDEVVREKQEAVNLLAADRAALQHATTNRNRPAMEALSNSLLYAESLFESMRDLLDGLVAYRRHQKSRAQSLAEHARQRLTSAQSHWCHHTQRHGSLPGTATAFREAHLWETTQRILHELGQ